MRGGYFINIDEDRSGEVAELLDTIKRERSDMLEFADGVAEAEELVRTNATGFDLTPLYPKLPAALNGLVEIAYDTNNQAQVRYLEPLVYRSAVDLAGTPDPEDVIEATFARNVRQLREIVRHAAARCRGNELTTDDLADEDRRALMRIALSSLQTAEAEQIREALRRANGNRVRAAAILKIGRSTLYRRLDAYARLGFDLEAEMRALPSMPRAGYLPTGSVERAAA